LSLFKSKFSFWIFVFIFILFVKVDRRGQIKSCKQGSQTLFRKIFSWNNPCNQQVLLA
jgi:hypothetical protein